MKSFDNNTLQTEAVQLARLSGAHGYRLDGDTVYLNAMFTLLHNEAHNQAWALQLWACPSAPVSAADVSGHIVAEVALPPMGELADESESFAMTAPALPPAGIGDFALVLVLASGRPGAFDRIHDFSVYARRESFVQPRLSGVVGYRVNGNRIQIVAERVENPRAAQNLSGTLALELWALSAPHAGQSFSGHRLAGVEFGALGGGNDFSPGAIELDFAQPPVGRWHVALLLREWTARGFVTRDFANFATTYVVERAVAPVAAKVAETVVAKPVVAPVEKKAVNQAAAKVTTPAVKLKPAPAPIPAKSATTPSVEKGVSINTALVEELAAVKGMNKKMAEGIVKNRPFGSLEDLRRVKGIGTAILAKIRASLKL